MKRHWAEANIPQWVKTSITDDIYKLEREAALSWPREADPQPAFVIGAYDRYIGPEPRPSGKFFVLRGTYVEPVTVLSWKGRAASQGQYYFTEREACLAALWVGCDQAAGNLAGLHRKFNKLNADAATAGSRPTEERRDQGLENHGRRWPQ